MIGLGLQHKDLETLSAELDLPAPQILGLLNRVIRRSVPYFNTILGRDVEEELEEATKVIIFLFNLVYVIANV